MIIDRKKLGEGIKTLQDLFEEYVASTPRKAASVLYNALPYQQQENLRRNAQTVSQAAQNVGQRMLGTPAGAQMLATGEMLSKLPTEAKMSINKQTGKPIELVTGTPIVPDAILPGGPSSAMLWAVGADEKMAKLAAQMLKSGKTPEEIRQATGLFRRYGVGGKPAGKWHKEFPDTEMEINFDDLIAKRRAELMNQADRYDDAKAMQLIAKANPLAGKTDATLAQAFEDQFKRKPHPNAAHTARNHPEHTLDMLIQKTADAIVDPASAGAVDYARVSLKHPGIDYEDPTYLDNLKLGVENLGLYTRGSYSPSNFGSYGEATINSRLLSKDLSSDLRKTTGHEVLHSVDQNVNQIPVVTGGPDDYVNQIFKINQPAEDLRQSNFLRQQSERILTENQGTTNWSNAAADAAQMYYKIHGHYPSTNAHSVALEYHRIGVSPEDQAADIAERISNYNRAVRENSGINLDDYADRMRRIKEYESSSSSAMQDTGKQMRDQLGRDLYKKEELEATARYVGNRVDKTAEQLETFPFTDPYVYQMETGVHPDNLIFMRNEIVNPTEMGGSILFPKEYTPNPNLGYAKGGTVNSLNDLHAKYTPGFAKGTTGTTDYTALFPKSSASGRMLADAERRKAQAETDRAKANLERRQFEQRNLGGDTGINPYALMNQKDIPADGLRYGSVKDYLQAHTGMDPNAKRLGLFPNIKTVSQATPERPYNTVDVTAPQWFYDFARAGATIPALSEGTPVTVEDINSLAANYNIAGLGSGMLSEMAGKPLPQGILGMSWRSLPKHLAKINKLKAGQKAAQYNFAGVEEAIPKIEKLANKMEESKELNTPFDPNPNASALTFNQFEKSKAFELNTNCSRRAQYGSTVCDLDNIMAEIRPDKPMLTDDELLNMAQYFHDQGKVAPCVFCYVEAGRRAKAKALANFVNPEGVGSFTNIEKYPARASVFQNLGSVPSDLFTNFEKYSNDPVFRQLYDEANKYAQGVAKSKVVRTKNAEYGGELLKMNDSQKKQYLKGLRGIRFSGSNDFEADQTVDWMQALVDASINNVPAYTYTKNDDTVKIFAPSGMKINQSVAVKLGPKDDWSKAAQDIHNGMDWNVVKENRDLYGSNIGSVLVATNDNQVKWGLSQPWIDIVIPGHHSGLTKEQMRRLDFKNYTRHSTIKKLFGDDPNYWKIVNDVRSPETITPIKPEFDFDAAQNAYDRYIQSGGYPERQLPDKEVIQHGVENVKQGKPAFAHGGAVNVYDPDHIEDIVNQTIKGI